MKQISIFKLIFFGLLLVSTVSGKNSPEWFVFNPQQTASISETDMTHWLDAPAGKHGFVQMKGDKLVFENGTAVKFWGTNIASNMPFMKNEEAREWAVFLSKYGFNAVRFHKFTWGASDGVHSTIITDEKWKNFDFLCNELRQKGIYYGWSHIYGHRPKTGDSSKMLAYKELSVTKLSPSHLNGTSSGIVNFAEDLQDLNIELTINMLNHVNEKTGLRYADDPALSFIEFQNEDDIFWGFMERILEQTPTYRKLLCSKFSNWLKNKYKSDENLRIAWNNEGFAENESIANETMYPQPNHGLFSWEYDQAIKENRPVKQHYLDKIAFLYEEQVKFYDKFEKAIRATGYKGTLVGSCWQAGSGLTHLLNLHSDYKAGIIDRHNYFGGGGGHTLKARKFNNLSMVSDIGSGLLSTGLQQVSDRPFAFSEWMSLIPNQWTAESAPIVAAYGMGLQGWDASYVFATDQPTYTETVQNPKGGIYNANSPTQLALYPALSAMIYRGDIKEGDVAVNRNISIKTALTGKTEFRERTVQDYDRKSFDAHFSSKLLAIGKVLLTFADTNSTVLDKRNAQLMLDSTVTSNTGQLVWSEKGKGYFTINSGGTKGIVGFAPQNKSFQLGDVKIKTDNEFAVILVTSLDKDKEICNARKILVTTMARAQNTDMKYNVDKTELLENGKAPILLEPVSFSLSMSNSKNTKMTILDHNGYKTKALIKKKKKNWCVDGAKTKAIYYLIER